MEGSTDDSPQYLRIDPLTGVGNPLAFFEWLLSHSETKPVPPFTLISLDVRGVRNLNDAHGRAAGNAALRWAALVLFEGSSSSHTKALRRISDRLSNEAGQVKLLPPAAFVAMIHYTGLEEISPNDVLGAIYGAFIEIKKDPGQSYKVFDAATTKPARDLSGVMDDLVSRMVALGSMLDKSQRLALTDSISGLPNVYAAMQELESIFNGAESKDEPFVILLIDGDDLSRYNKIGYLAGDEMIKRLGKSLDGELRPIDFIARWRTGDEFLVLLRDTSPKYSVPIAERLRQAVHDVSQEWEFPITVSIGVAGHPEHGRSSKELLHYAELALDRAKNSGKNQVVLAGDQD
jgi:diguanylate cyclase (GGDEF)-like protein